MTTLIAGFVLWGGLGWLLDQWWDTRLMTPIGLIVGMALSIYAVVARHGRVTPAERSAAQAYTARSATAAAARKRSIAVIDPVAVFPTAPDPQATVPTHRRDGPPPAGTRRETA